MKHQLTAVNHSFGCDRTCRPFSEVCKFSSLLNALGAARVTSNTLVCKVEVKNMTALSNVAVKLGHKVLGQGKHKLYATTEEGFGLKLKGWSYPVIFKPEGIMAYDDYNGHWGNKNDLQALQGQYTLEAARLEAEALGWYCTLDGDRLIVDHPGGGTLTITPDGVIDAANFMGHGCTEATAAFQQALGKQISQELKPEYVDNIGHVGVVGGE